MKTILGTLLLFAAIQLQAETLSCRQYTPNQGANPRPDIRFKITQVPSKLPVYAKINIDKNVTLKLSTSEGVLGTLNSITLEPDTWLSGSNFEAYSNTGNEDLLYAIYFEKNWKTAKDSVTIAFIAIDDMKLGKSDRIMFVCMREAVFNKIR